MVKQKSKNVGPIVGTLIVIIVLIAASLYVFATHINRQAKLQSNASSKTTVYTQSNDDIQTLQYDLNN